MAELHGKWVESENGACQCRLDSAVEKQPMKDGVDEEIAAVVAAAGVWHHQCNSVWIACQNLHDVEIVPKVQESEQILSSLRCHSMLPYIGNTIAG